MKVGDLIRFVSTGCHGMVTRIQQVGAIELVHVLCGPDIEGENNGDTLAFPRLHIETCAEVINASR
jgi:hypothetical protein